MEYVKKSAFVNCWHQSDWESAAMWALYAQRHGLAVKSTVAALQRSFASDVRDVFVVRVRYTDKLPDEPPVIRAIFRKRPSFAHEREIRAFICC